jgi:hypothetical protein
MRAAAGLLAAWWASAALPALAQSFPADRAWQPFSCGAGAAAMTDGVGDQSGFPAERDVVGTSAAPAGLRAADANFFYLRLRLDQDPLQGPNLRPFVWGFAFSTDGQATGYEALVTVDGTSGMVALYRNGAVTLADSPEDPADAPPLASYPFGTHGRVVAAESALGGNRDYFLDLAVPWRDLATVPLSAETRVVTWAGSSSNPDRLNGDLACHDGRGSSAVSNLSGSASTTDRAAPAPTGAGGAGGGAGGGTGAGGISIEGGPGCAYGPRRPARGLGVAMAFLAACSLARRKRR